MKVIQFFRSFDTDYNSKWVVIYITKWRNGRDISSQVSLGIIKRIVIFVEVPRSRDLEYECEYTRIYQSI